MKVPFFRPDLAEAEIDGVVETLRSGWLTSGARARRFEEEFAAAVGGQHAVAVNSCTAAMHLSVVALDLSPGDAVLVPTMTFAATAEVVRYCGALPILVDCDPVTLHIDLEDAERKAAQYSRNQLPIASPGPVVGLMPVHVGGLMVPLDPLRHLAAAHELWVVEDAAHAFPSMIQTERGTLRCGEGTADATCFSFYANKTITTGEGGMVVTDRDELAGRIRRLALHGLSTDAWDRYAPAKDTIPRWDYQILEAGYKYNLTDIAAAIGLGQLERAEAMRAAREAIARAYSAHFADCELFETPPISDSTSDAGQPDAGQPSASQHAWHLYPIRLHLDRLTLDRNRFAERLAEHGVGFSVHWRPLHLHPYYRGFGWRPDDLPNASATWERLVSLPLFPTMTESERVHVIETVLRVANEHAR